MSEDIKLFDTAPFLARLKTRKLQSSVQKEVDPELQVVDSFIKLSKSIIVMLIPADDSYSEKKGFSWDIEIYDDSNLGIKLKFEHPKYISSTGIDTLMVTFYNSKAFMAPVDQSKNSLPDGFTRIIKLPPQGVNLMTVEELNEAKMDS